MIRIEAGLFGLVFFLGTTFLSALFTVMTPAAAAAQSPGGTTLYVSSAGNNRNSGTVSSSAYKTIQHAVDIAETIAGSVTIDVYGGSYPEQVTITPSVGSPLTTLTLVGGFGGSGATVVQPTSLKQNLNEGTTGYFFDDNTGNTAAIVGVQPLNAATATVEDLTIDGSALGGLPPGGMLEGIGFIDASGVIQGNTVENIEQPNAMGQAAVHGIEVKSTSQAENVTVSNNILLKNPGHVAIDLMSRGTLSAVVSGNQITGTPVSTLSPVAQFGVAAGGLAALSITGNTISDMSSPWGVGGVWLDAQGGATCTVADNTLTGNDNGIDVNGASGCVISGNTIAAGSAGIAVGEQFYGPTVSSNENVISDNTITGTSTVATTTVTFNGMSP
ncbi:MAG: right-handed parallel beta-helix repeat-containing protein, partial [Thermaerobacter sp.]|nr:right-handed parallel beta-helix repeat-containing protein [Thermaerobacter sp.]